MLIEHHFAMRLTALLLLTLAVGCSDTCDSFQRVPVKGKVSFDGQPLSKGVIRFLPDSSVAGRNVEAVVTNGEYALGKTSGPVAGKHRVEIEATYHLSFSRDDEAAYATQVQLNGALSSNPIPAQFNRQSQLTTDIPKDGSDQLSFYLAMQGSR